MTRLYTYKQRMVAEMDIARASTTEAGQGWELTHVHPVTRYASPMVVLVFKRPVPLKAAT